MSFVKGFDRYICVDDSITCNVDGITYTARIAHDADTIISDFACYDAEAIEAWNKDEWHYYGVVIDAERNGWVKHHVAALWGIEGNFPGSDNSYLTQVANDLLLEAKAILDKEKENA